MAKKTFSINRLSDKDKENFNFVEKRIAQLQDARKREQYGIELEKIWLDADQDYAPHTITRAKGKKVYVEDETKGWRGASTITSLEQNKWRSDLSQANPFIKIQTALSILIDQNPSAIFTPTRKKYQDTTNLIKQLYENSWHMAKSKQQLKLFVFNLAKYGWACGRTYPLRLTNNVKNLVEWNAEDPSKSVYEDKEVVEYNDVMRENLDPWNVWIDDMAKPNNPRSIKDWTWRKVYTMEEAEREFGAWPNFKYVQAGGTTTDIIDNDRNITKQYTSDDLVEAYFYENKSKDLFHVHLNKVPVVMSPLPISDSEGNKKLSLWQAYWNLRHAECPYGIGIYEAIRHDQNLLDRVRNMTIDQMTLSIYKMFFYTGTSTLTDTGDIKIAPGQGKQTLDPKNITFMEVPGPGRDAYEGLQMFRKDLDEASGITDPLLGNITGKTAFEIAQAKEAALKRLKTPLDNITDALDLEAYITISLIQLIYSIPEIYTIADPYLIDQYLKEIDGDQDLFARDEEDNFQAKVYRELPLKVETDEKGQLIETQDARFIRIKPRYLKWEGIINVKSQSVLTPSKQVDKSLELEMYNLLIPLFAQPPELYKKVAESIVRLYDKDPKDILPEVWLQEQAPQAPQEPLIVPTNAPKAETVTSINTNFNAGSPDSVSQELTSMVGA